MFTVKATYRGETRRLTFPLTFPAFDQLCEQLRRVFPLSNVFVLSRLLFSPNSTKSIRLLIGQRVHTAEDYIRYVEPYKGRLWQDATLRLTVLDGNPGESPTATESASKYWPQAAHSASNNTSLNSTDAQVSFSGHPISMSCIPPPPILYPSFPVPDTPTTRSPSQNRGMMPNTGVETIPCCSIDASKREVQTLLDSFVRDLNKLVTNMFPVQDVLESSGRGQQHTDDSHVCTGCKRYMTFYCKLCGMDICLACTVLTKCATATGYHHIMCRTRELNGPSRYPKSTGSIPPSAGPPRAPARSFVTPRSCSTTSMSTQSAVQLPSREKIEQPCIYVPPHRSNSGMRTVCDLCDSVIIDIIYKCLDCPDFDTCASCFSITREQHPRHSFVKVSHPADYIRRPVLRRQHRAMCNGCNNMIFGVRYKCLHPECPDFDLCERCEALPIPQHPEHHPLLKLKSVDTMIPLVQTITCPTAPAANEEVMTQESPTCKATDLESKSLVKTPSPDGNTLEPQLVDTCHDRGLGFLRPEQYAVSVSSSTCGEMPQPIKVGEYFKEKEEIASTSEVSSNDKSEVKGTLVASPIETPFTLPLMNKTSPIPPPVYDALPGATTSLSTLLGKVLEDQQTGLSFNAMDITVPRGQIFPPGAEFIKTWRVTNDGLVEWPETTELVFAGGDVMTLNLDPILIGKVGTGAKIKISTRELKAPELPGRYVSRWMLRTRELGLFGDGLWIDIYVTDEGSESLSSSSVMKMPHPASRENSRSTLDGQLLRAGTSERLTDKAISDTESSGTAGTADNLSYDSDWQDCPIEPAGREEYVILYDDSSSEEN